MTFLPRSLTMTRRNRNKNSAKASESRSDRSGKPKQRSAGKKATSKKSTSKKAPSGASRSAGRPSTNPYKGKGSKRSVKPAAAKAKGTRGNSAGSRASGSASGSSATGNAIASTRNEPQRLQRLLAAAGFGSRRQCEDLIQEARVEINGEIVAELGTVVDPKSDKIKVDGVPLRQQKLVYYAVNKPTGFLSTNADPRGRQRVIDLVPRSERVFPVGRLDASSQGLMLLTNDGDLAQQLAHPKYGIRKVYRVTVAGKIDGETMRSMRKGIYISDGFVRVEGARILKSRSRATDLEITLREGKNREIRRILARLGHKVQVLRRIAIGPLRLGDLPVGAHRALSREEVKRLRIAIEHSRDEVEEPRPRNRGAGGAKRSAKKKSTGKRKRPESKHAVTARRTQRSPATTKFTFKPKSSDGGSVIGGD